MAKILKVKMDHQIFVKCNPRSIRQALLLTVASIGLSGGIISHAHAFPISTSSPDLQVNLDTTVEGNLLFRTEGSSPDSYNNPNGDDVARNFRSGPAALRLDIDTALNVKYDDFGFRVSGSGWEDLVYDMDNFNNSPNTINYFTNQTTSYSRGAKGLAGHRVELDDAFTYGEFSFGDGQSLSYRVGQFVQIWGESLYLLNNGIASAMNPIDGIRAQLLLDPQFRDVAIPTPQISLQYQPTQSLTFGAYAKFGWRATRIPPGGSYFSPADILGAGASYIFNPLPAFGLPNAYFNRLTDIRPNGNAEQYGAKVAYQGDSTDYGLYFVNFASYAPSIYVHPFAIPNFATQQIGTYQLVYARNIQLFGASASTDVNLGNQPVQFGFELSWRHHNVLTSSSVVAPTYASNYHNVFYPVGNTGHYQVSFTYASPPLPSIRSDQMSISGEVGGNKLISVSENKEALTPKTNGFTATGTVNVGLQYYNIFPAFDMNPSVEVSYNPLGNSASDPSQVHGGGSFSVADVFTYRKVLNMTVQYHHYFGSLKTTVGGGSDPSQSLYGRDYVGLEGDTSF